MALSTAYFDYLDHFEATVSVSQLFERPHATDMIALRHDVDYDLDLALEMSFWEKERGVQSTYYLLHTAPYWNAPQFIDKCLQIQDFGHEIGLHLNLLSEWVQGKINDIASTLDHILTPLRQAGVRLTGVAAHGDKLCYQHQFINYWCFTELKPQNPEISEDGLSAEGIPVLEPKFRISYPDSHQLARDDGCQLPLWSVSMQEFGLVYDAAHVGYDGYFTDSGGKWTRSPDPLQQSLKTGRYQILMHPIYWRGPQKIYFFLSTARSGSKWLVNLLESASSVHARHEFSLNHRFQEEELLADKRTTDNFLDLVQNQIEAEELLREARTWIAKLPGDYAEANVYLERFLPALEEIFPTALFVHLHRNPKAVIRSIINKGWYDTPDDARHPRIEITQWDSLRQFEKACWYVRHTNDSLLAICQERLSFEQAVTDIKDLSARLKHLGIALYPRLALNEHGKQINANRENQFPDYRTWSIRKKWTFHVICAPINQALGYQAGAIISYLSRLLKKPFFYFQYSSTVGTKRHLSPVVMHDVDYQEIPLSTPPTYSSRGCSLHLSAEGIRIVPDGDRHVHFLFGGGTWQNLKPDEGWTSHPACYYRFFLEASIIQDGGVQLFCLTYTQNGSLLTTRRLCSLSHRRGGGTLACSFRVQSHVQRFNLALYMSHSNLPSHVYLKRIRLERKFL